jgi:hypothetical protein
MSEETAKPEHWQLEDDRNSRTRALYAALAKAQADLRGVEKGSRNDYHKYVYASAEDMMAAATESLGKFGLAFICVGSSFDKQAQAVTAKYIVTHKDGGIMELGSHQITVHPDKGRPMDKAISTALTYLQAYTLRGAFNIPRVPEGTERDSQDDKQIAEYNRELDNARKEREKAQREAHNAKLKALATKKKAVKKASVEFFKAAGLPQGKVQLLAFVQWAACLQKYPTKHEDEMAACDEAMQILIEWQQADEDEAMSQAQQFRSEHFPKSDPAKDDDGFEKSVRGDA